jgi:hypothetical protein
MFKNNIKFRKTWNLLNVHVILVLPRANMQKMPSIVDRTQRPDICSNEQQQGMKKVHR